MTANLGFTIGGVVLGVAALFVLLFLLHRGFIRSLLAGKRFSGEERRRHIRLRADLPVYLRFSPGKPADARIREGGGNWRPCHLRDISAGGVCLEVPIDDPEVWEKIRRGELVPSFRVVLGELGQQVEAEVYPIWRVGPSEQSPHVLVAGFRYARIDMDARRTIGSYVWAAYQPGLYELSEGEKPSL